MNTIVIGDIHGHVDSVERALEYDGNVVFIGDYLDSFTQSPENQARCLRMVLDAIEDSEEGRVIGLLGNHELSYLERGQRCSGWNPETQAWVDRIGHNRIKKVLKPYHWVGEYLLTHAGVSQGLLDAMSMSLMEYLEVGQYTQIGRVRGGFGSDGGLFWNDFNFEMQPPNGVKQVVGHSNGRSSGEEPGVRVKYSEDGTGEVWCVDNLCRVPEVLELREDGSAAPVLI